MKNWLRQHRFALSVAFAHLRAAPAGFAFNVLVVAIALALPIAGLTLLENVRPLSEELAVEPEMSLFLALDLPRPQAIALEKSLGEFCKPISSAPKLSLCHATSAGQFTNARRDGRCGLDTRPKPLTRQLYIEARKLSKCPSCAKNRATRRTNAWHCGRRKCAN